MKHLKRFENFSNYQYLNDIDFNVDDNTLFKNILLNVCKKNNVNNESFIKIIDDINNDILNESFFDSLKDKFDSFVNNDNEISKNGKNIFKTILNKAKDVFSFVKKISSGIKEYFISIIEESKEKFISLFEKNNEIKSKIHELSNTKKEGLKIDINTSRNVIKWYRTEFLNNLLNKSDKGLSDILTSDVSISEEFSDGNMLSKFIHKIESIPPFSLLHKIAKAGEAGSNHIISLLSDLTNKLGGPSFELPVISLLIGILLEQFVKNSSGHWIIDMVGATTPFGIAIKGIKLVALFVAFIVAIDAILGEKLLAQKTKH